MRGFLFKNIFEYLVVDMYIFIKGWCILSSIGYLEFCTLWFFSTEQEEPEAMLPRISPSLFLTPGGAKFYQLLYRFSRYVILQVNDKENGG